MGFLMLHLEVAYGRTQSRAALRDDVSATAPCGQLFLTTWQKADQNIAPLQAERSKEGKEKSANQWLSNLSGHHNRLVGLTHRRVGPSQEFLIQ